VARKSPVAREPEEIAAPAHRWSALASGGESRWPATLAVVAAIVIQYVLPDKLLPGPRYLLPALETVLLIPLVLVNPRRLDHDSRDTRWLSITLIAVVNAANAASLVLLVRYLLHGGKADGRTLIYAAIGVWLTNIIVFALWYWEIDRGGPITRARPNPPPPGFLFAQMTTPGLSSVAWAPTFVDYLYVAFTNATAFSPTDTMPLTRTAKMLMLVQSLASLTTIAIVGARAVNILG
jgi:uncharacterized membrane protein